MFLPRSNLFLVSYHFDNCFDQLHIFFISSSSFFYHWSSWIRNSLLGQMGGWGRNYELESSQSCQSGSFFFAFPDCPCCDYVLSPRSKKLERYTRMATSIHRFFSSPSPSSYITAAWRTQSKRPIGKIIWHGTVLLKDQTTTSGFCHQATRFLLNLPTRSPLAEQTFLAVDKATQKRHDRRKVYDLRLGSAFMMGRPVNDELDNPLKSSTHCWPLQNHRYEGYWYLQLHWWNSRTAMLLGSMILRYSSSVTRSSWTCWVEKYPTSTPASWIKRRLRMAISPCDDIKDMGQGFWIFLDKVCNHLVSTRLIRTEPAFQIRNGREDVVEKKQSLHGNGIEFPWPLQFVFQSKDDALQSVEYLFQFLDWCDLSRIKSTRIVEEAIAHNLDKIVEISST